MDGDAAQVLQAAAGVLDQVAPPVSLPIVADCTLAVAAAGDHRRILTDVITNFGSRDEGRNIKTTGMWALRLNVEGGVGAHFFYRFETDFSENKVDIVTAFVGWKNRIVPGLEYDVRVGNLFNDRGFEVSTGSDSMTFLERTTDATAIIPQRGFDGLGVMPRLFWRTFRKHDFRMDDVGIVREIMVAPESVIMQPFRRTHTLFRPAIDFAAFLSFAGVAGY